MTRVPRGLFYLHGPSHTCVIGAEVSTIGAQRPGRAQFNFISAVCSSGKQPHMEQFAGDMWLTCRGSVRAGQSSHVLNTAVQRLTLIASKKLTVMTQNAAWHLLQNTGL